MRELTRQLQLQHLVIESFIPHADIEKLEARAVWDGDAEEWRLRPLADMRERESALQRPVSHPWLHRPTCLFASELSHDQAAGGGLRFRADNLLALDLDLPERTTADYEVDDLQPNVRAALSAALQTEEEIELEAEENLPNMVRSNAPPPHKAEPSGQRPRRKKKAAARSEAEELDVLLSGRAEEEAPAEEVFPEARGLGGGRRR